MTARASTMARLAAHARVELCDDEREIGNGVIVTLRQGWTWDRLQDNRVAGFDTPSEALRQVRRGAIAFAGPYTN